MAHRTGIVIAALVVAILGISAQAQMQIVDLPAVGTDAASDISTTKTYTHTLNFSSTTTGNLTINGVDFKNVGATTPGTSLQGNGYTFATSAGSVTGHAGADSVNGQADGQMNALLRAMVYHGGNPAAGATITVGLQGLTPGASYSTRFYYRNWDSVIRSFDIAADGGNNGVFTTYLTGVNWDAGGAHYVEYLFTADDADVQIRFTVITATKGIHIYGLTNEVMGGVKDPIPANNSTVDQDLAELSWTNPEFDDPNNPITVAGKVVYFGLDPNRLQRMESVDLAPDASSVAINTTNFPTYGVLEGNQRYYWAVDIETDCGDNCNDPNYISKVIMGPMWSFLVRPAVDDTAPTPNPMTWSKVPAATSYDTIEMTATTATDDWHDVEYYFENITDSAHDSGWQDSPVYINTGLQNDTTYEYRVIARDKSPNLNETEWSESASATTPEWVCTGAIKGDFNGDCQVNMIDFALLAAAWEGAEAAPVNLVVNGDFASNLDGWTLNLVTAGVTIEWAEVDGDGAAKLNKPINSSAAPDMNIRQVVPVESGKKYKFSAEWKGTLVQDPPLGIRNWAEVYVGWGTSLTATNTNVSAYKKRSEAEINGGNSPWDWESIHASPDRGAVDGVFTATTDFMVLTFRLGGRANGDEAHYYVDNVSVTEDAPCPVGDMDGNCELDYLDLAEFVKVWLDCNRGPASECWQD